MSSSKNAASMLLIIGFMATSVSCERDQPPTPAKTADRSAAVVEQETTPARPTTDPRYVKCWVHIANSHPTADFKNPYDRVRGPIELPNLRELTGTRHRDWNNKIDVLSTGATARVTIWSDENYKGKSLTVGPNEKLSDVAALELGDGISSLKIEYAPKNDR